MGATIILFILLLVNIYYNEIWQATSDALLLLLYF
jgi:hypothetical protein